MMSEIQPQCFGLLLAQDRPVTSARLWNNKTEVGRTFLSSLHVSWDPVTLEVHDTMCVTHALLTAGCCRCRGLAWGWPREPKSTLVPSCNLPGLHLTPQEGCLELDASRAKQLQGLDPTRLCELNAGKWSGLGTHGISQDSWGRLPAVG